MAENERTHRTPNGEFIKDKCGLWHYISLPGQSMWYAMKDAAENLPPGPAWFWWRAIPTPILPGDTTDTLHSRYVGWAQYHNAGYLSSRLYAFMKD